MLTIPILGHLPLPELWFFLGGLGLGAVVFGLLKNRHNRLLAACRTECAIGEEKRQALTQNCGRLQTQVDRLSIDLQQHQERHAELQAAHAVVSALLEEERRHHAEKIVLLNQAGERLKSEFQNLAHQILDDNSRLFADQNRLAIDRLITPLRDQMGDFKKRIEDVYDKESRDRIALQAEIHHLKELNQQIGQEALNLTRALKGDSKTRGHWGELVLERVLEASGLVKGREYKLQVSLLTAEGQRMQPDALIHLPDGKQMVVDAKVSLRHYEAFFNAEVPAERNRHLTSHVDAMRLHIRSLSAKQYEALQGLSTLDFVLMFVPIEAALIAAVEKDHDLFQEALEKNIMLVSPSTLMIALRTIQNIWRRDQQNRNAVEIAHKAGALYDKFVGFVQILEEVGRHLDQATSAFRIVHDRLIDGRGNLVRRALELKALGVKSNKQLAKELIERATDEDDSPSSTAGNFL